MIWELVGDLKEKPVPKLCLKKQKKNHQQQQQQNLQSSEVCGRDLDCPLSKLWLLFGAERRAMAARKPADIKPEGSLLEPTGELPRVQAETTTEAHASPNAQIGGTSGQPVGLG